MNRKQAKALSVLLDKGKLKEFLDDLESDEFKPIRHLLYIREARNLQDCHDAGLIKAYAEGKDICFADGAPVEQLSYWSGPEMYMVADEAKEVA